MNNTTPKKSRFNARISNEKLAADRLRAVTQALAEDIGGGDVTAALVSAAEMAEASVVVREEAVLCGRDWFDLVFAQLDGEIDIEWLAGDGDVIQAGQIVCRLKGQARALLTGERTALNFLQTLSGTATTARRYAAIVEDTGCRILDTRKTLPGLRLAQKYAARTGGAVNHRIGLFDAILIKENHIASAGSTADAVRNARAANPALPVEIEVESIAQMREALETGVERLLLDNFSLDELREAVAINSAAEDAAELEASGGVNIDTLRAIAETGVDFISVGALTKHVTAVDYSMRFVFA